MFTGLHRRLSGGNGVETEILDKLYLELSQITTAMTGKELRYLQVMERVLDHLRHAIYRNGPIIQAISLLEKTLASDSLYSTANRPIKAVIDGDNQR